MPNEVYANNREISCKSGDSKSICCFPDVCMTPPENPATPPGVPIPYPNTGLASDTTEGSKSVQISDKEIMLKNKSYFKKSMGDEAGCAAKKGVVTSVNRGKVYFIAWSMDVKVEGENVVRHLDLTTHNHASPVANTLFTPHIAKLTRKQAAACAAKKKKAADDCEGKVPDRCDDACKDAQKCQLVPYNKADSQCCAEANTGDHIVEASAFHDVGRGGSGSSTLVGCEDYNTNTAPCCCVSGGAYSGEHGRMSALRGLGALECEPGTVTTSSGVELDKPHVTTYGAAKKRAARALVLTFPQCKEECILAQFDSYDKEHNLSNETQIRATTYGGEESIENRAVKLDNQEQVASMTTALGTP